MTILCYWHYISPITYTYAELGVLCLNKVPVAYSAKNTMLITERRAALSEKRMSLFKLNFH